MKGIFFYLKQMANQRQTITALSRLFDLECMHFKLKEQSWVTKTKLLTV